MNANQQKKLKLFTIYKDISESQDNSTNPSKYI